MFNSLTSSFLSGAKNGFVYANLFGGPLLAGYSIIINNPLGVLLGSIIYGMSLLCLIKL